MVLRVLLVEDDALVASGIVAGLRLHGFTVDHVERAGQAQAALATSHADACILDLGLPDEDGLVLLGRWRRQKQTLPVLVLTARDAVAHRVKGFGRPAQMTIWSSRSTWTSLWPGCMRSCGEPPAEVPTLSNTARCRSRHPPER